MTVSDLHDDVEAAVAGSGEPWEKTFYRAVNSVISDLRRETLLEVDYIDEDTEEVDLSQDFDPVLLLGTIHYMQLYRPALRSNVEISVTMYRDKLQMAQSQAIIEADPETWLDYEEEE